MRVPTSLDTNGDQKDSTVDHRVTVEKLAAIGVVDSVPNIRNKFSRGKFTAVFLIQCLEALVVQSLRLE
jgi:hypothetical protein